MTASEDRDTARDLLRAWFETGSDAEARPLLERLFSSHIQPWCSEAARRTLRVYSQKNLDWDDQAAELEAEVLLQLTARLTHLRQAGEDPVQDLRAYVVSAVYNACFTRFRARCPGRVQLQNRIRYLLRRDPRFALWQAADGEFLAGFARWKGVEEGRATPAALSFAPADLAAMIEKVFQTTGRPVTFSDLVALAAEALGIRDTLPVSLSVVEDIPAAGTPVLNSLIDRQHLSRLWREIVCLPANQRCAVLLNLRDAAGNGVIELIPASGVATFDELAASLEMSGEDLAALWNELPLDDARIGARLGVSRQQVINLRKSAREKLTRRLRKEENMGRNSASNVKVGPLQKAGRAIKKLFGTPHPEVQ